MGTGPLFFGRHMYPSPGNLSCSEKMMAAAGFIPQMMGARTLRIAERRATYFRVFRIARPNAKSRFDFGFAVQIKTKNYETNPPKNHKNRQC